jgi:hypothetical protein
VTYVYRAYGLTCESNVQIAGLSVHNAEPKSADLLIEISSEPPKWVHSARKLAFTARNGKSAAPGLPDAAYTLTLFGNREAFELEYADGSRFTIDGAGERMWATCEAPLTSEDLGVYLRGPVFGLVLQRRGVTVLHASAFSVEGHAVALCGPSETGKSTTAAALALRGTPILSDDMAALSGANGGVYIEPGYPRICLWPEAVQDLLGARNGLPPLTPNWEKCYLPLDGARAHFESQKCPLKLIYLLAPRVNDAMAPRVEEMSASQALLELVQNTYMNWFLDRNQRAAEFGFLSRLVAEIPVRRIVPHPDPGRIGVICDLILADAKRSIAGVDQAAIANTI